MARTRIFNSKQYELYNAYYGERALKQLKRDIQWAKSHGIRYRITKVVRPAKGKLMWIKKVI